ncbi:hypothetical protein WA158_006684 [Blastocystis sp. Blastoise]
MSDQQFVDGIQGLNTNLLSFKLITDANTLLQSELSILDSLKCKSAVTYQEFYDLISDEIIHICLTMPALDFFPLLNQTKIDIDIWMSLFLKSIPLFERFLLSISLFIQQNPQLSYKDTVFCLIEVIFEKCNNLSTFESSFTNFILSYSLSQQYHYILLLYVPHFTVFLLLPKLNFIKENNNLQDNIFIFIELLKLSRNNDNITIYQYIYQYITNLPMSTQFIIYTYIYKHDYLLDFIQAINSVFSEWIPFIYKTLYTSTSVSIYIDYIYTYISLYPVMSVYISTIPQLIALPNTITLQAYHFYFQFISTIIQKIYIPSFKIYVSPLLLYIKQSIPIPLYIYKLLLNYMNKETQSYDLYPLFYPPIPKSLYVPLCHVIFNQLVAYISLHQFPSFFLYSSSLPPYIYNSISSSSSSSSFISIYKEMKLQTSPLSINNTNNQENPENTIETLPIPLILLLILTSQDLYIYLKEKKPSESQYIPDLILTIFHSICSDFFIQLPLTSSRTDMISILTNHLSLYHSLLYNSSSSSSLLHIYINTSSLSIYNHTYEHINLKHYCTQMNTIPFSMKSIQDIHEDEDEDENENIYINSDLFVPIKRDDIYRDIYKEIHISSENYIINKKRSISIYNNLLHYLNCYEIQRDCLSLFIRSSYFTDLLALMNPYIYPVPISFLLLLLPHLKTYIQKQSKNSVIPSSIYSFFFMVAQICISKHPKIYILQIFAKYIYKFNKSQLLMYISFLQLLLEQPNISIYSCIPLFYSFFKNLTGDEEVYIDIVSSIETSFMNR